MSKFFTTEKLSPHREKTPEGFLLCRDVPISRVGIFDYKPHETGIQGQNGVVKMTCSEDELFNPDTMASFEGKPVVIGHDRFADPTNWKQIAVGHVQNVRRGEGDQSDLLLADLLLQDQKGIDLVMSGALTEVSCGYDAQSIEDGVGRGHQAGIVGNHLALVDKARRGGRCKIGDSMTKSNSWKSALRRLFKDGDEEGFNEKLDELPVEMPKADEEPAPQPSDSERIAALETTVKALAEQIAAMKTEKVADEDSKQCDECNKQGDECQKQCDEDPEAAVVPEEEVAEVMSDAEEVCPGIAKPSADAEGGKFTRGTINRLKRSALKEAQVKSFGDSAALRGDALDVAFKAAVEIARAKHNPTVKVGDSATVGRKSNSQLNVLFNKFWSA